MTLSEEYLLASASISENVWSQKNHLTGEYKATCKVPSNFLNDGIFNFTILLIKDLNQVLIQLDNILSVEVVDLATNRDGYYGKWNGIIRPILDWKIEKTLN